MPRLNSTLAAASMTRRRRSTYSRPAFRPSATPANTAATKCAPAVSREPRVARPRLVLQFRRMLDEIEHQRVRRHQRKERNPTHASGAFIVGSARRSTGALCSKFWMATSPTPTATAATRNWRCFVPGKPAVHCRFRKPPRCQGRLPSPAGRPRFPGAASGERHRSDADAGPGRGAPTRNRTTFVASQLTPTAAPARINPVTISCLPFRGVKIRALATPAPRYRPPPFPTGSTATPNRSRRTPLSARSTIQTARRSENRRRSTPPWRRRNHHARRGMKFSRHSASLSGLGFNGGGGWRRLG